jgi:hypothetical protein
VIAGFSRSMSIPATLTVAVLPALSVAVLVTD